VSEETIRSLGAPDTIETDRGTLNFLDGVPTVETGSKVYDTLNFTRALNAYNNSFRGASALAIVKGFEGIGAKPGDVVIFSELMDANSLFLTANADTVYYLAGLDLSNGPIVLEQPSNAVGTINDMWFSWIIDVGGPGPDRGLGGKYLIVGPDYHGPLPEGGYFITHSKTNFALYAARAYLVDSDPKPAVENVKKNLKIYAYQPGSFGTSIAQALDGTVRIAGEPKIPETRFIEGTGLSFNTIPPSDYGFFELINENVQSQPATSYDVELAGQLAAMASLTARSSHRTIGSKRYCRTRPHSAKRPDVHSTGVMRWSIRIRPFTKGRSGAACFGRVAHSSRSRRRFSRTACSSRYRRPEPAPSIRARPSTTATRSIRPA